MADGEGAAAAAGGGGEAEGGAGAGSAGGQALTEDTAAPAEWLGSLPDDLKADATLSRYKSVEDLARGHLETKALATSKLAIPGKDAGDDDWGRVYDALGRPQEPGAYELPLPALPDDADDSAKTARAETEKAYQDLFHQAGLNPKQASALVAADLARLEAAQSAYYAQGAEDVAALKAELGADYDGQVEAAKAVFKKLGFDPKFADELDLKVGSATLLRGFMKLAKVAGEHIRVDGGGGDFGVPQDAHAALVAKQADPTWREKFNAGDATVLAEHARLLKAAQSQAVAAGGAIGSFVSVAP